MVRNAGFSPRTTAAAKCARAVSATAGGTNEETMMKAGAPAITATTRGAAAASTMPPASMARGSSCQSARVPRRASNGRVAVTTVDGPAAVALGTWTARDGGHQSFSPLDAMDCTM